VLLKEALVVGDAVLTEHPPVKERVFVSKFLYQLGRVVLLVVPELGQLSSAYHDRECVPNRLIDCDNLPNNIGETYPAMRGAVRNILAVNECKEEVL
jgi:hypothetical protein